LSIEAIAKRLLSTQANFTPFALEQLEGRVYELAPHQQIMCDVLDRVISGEIKRLIINVPPGYAKTAIAVWAFVARGFAINPSSKFLHISYSDTLVNDNSSNIRDIINSSDYQSLFPYMSFHPDTQAKGLWKTNRGGAFRAASSGGAITGFRAGLIGSSIFSGAMIVDDPLKPDDAYSETVRGFINGRWKNVFRSRLASPDVPVIVIMQRLHIDDFTSHLLNNSGEEWHHLVLPAYIAGNKPYQHEGRAIPIPYDLPSGSLWPQKYDDATALDLMSDGQYSQRPIKDGGEFFGEAQLLVEGRPAVLENRVDQVYAVIDTALKDGLEHDGTAVTYFAHNKIAGIPLVVLDYDVLQISGDLLDTWLPTVEHRLEQLARDTNSRQGSIGIWIEDKASGTVLIQQAQRKGMNVYAIDGALTALGKDGRALSVSGYVNRGMVKISAGVYDKVCVYRGVSRNHFLTQICGFRVGAKTPHGMDLLDSFVYGVAIGLGDSFGY
jgi:phage terminase large subunit-like protein